ncbi:MAG: AMP-binding protein, partial [Planctomycetales bacterium]
MSLEQKLAFEPTFPIHPLWHTKTESWHRHYPKGVPRGFAIEPLRAEQLLLRSVASFPQRHALRYFQTHWTYEEFLRRVQTVAANLQRIGIGVGDRVVLGLPNCPEFAAAWFALHWIGAQVVPTNPLLTTKELSHLADKTQAKAMFGLDMKLAPLAECVRQRPGTILISASLAPHLPWHWSLPYRLKVALDPNSRPPQGIRFHKFSELYRNVSPLTEPVLHDPGLPAVLQPTGGTTGLPKLAVLTHANLHANLTQVHLWSGLQPGKEVVLAVLPFFHIFGSMVSLLSPIAGAATILPQARFVPSVIWKVIEKWKPTVIPMVPFMFSGLCDEMERRKRS